jgi:hypothetical protein
MHTHPSDKEVIRQGNGSMDSTRWHDKRAASYQSDGFPVTGNGPECRSVVRADNGLEMTVL